MGRGGPAPLCKIWLAGALTEGCTGGLLEPGSPKMVSSCLYVLSMCRGAFPRWES